MPTTLTPSLGSLTSTSSSGVSGASGPERKPSLSQRIRPGRWSLTQDVGGGCTIEGQAG